MIPKHRREVRFLLRPQSPPQPPALGGHCTEASAVPVISILCVSMRSSAGMRADAARTAPWGCVRTPTVSTVIPSVLMFRNKRALLAVWGWFLTFSVWGSGLSGVVSYFLWGSGLWPPVLFTPFWLGSGWPTFPLRTCFIFIPHVFWVVHSTFSFPSSPFSLFCYIVPA